MKQDIRKLFEREDEDDFQELPSNHRKVFQMKLRKDKPELKSSFIFKVAVLALVLIGTTFGFYNSHTTISSGETILSQMDKIEKDYLKSIEKEWQDFTSATNDSILIKRFQNKLYDLSQDYNNLSNQLESNPDNTIIIQSLIDNLQTRLKLLEDIQNHIKLLNSKPDENEAIL